MIVIQLREIMSRHLVTATPETSLGEARHLMAEHRIRRLPIMIGRRLVGIVSDRDLRSAGASQSPTPPVAQIMTRNVVTVTSQTRVDEAARIIIAGRFGGLPVVDGGELVGIVTETDLLRALIAVLETDATERIAIDFGGAA
jgi:acetoin utilization protein AcuB